MNCRLVVGLATSISKPVSLFLSIFSIFLLKVAYSVSFVRKNTRNASLMFFCALILRTLFACTVDCTTVLLMQKVDYSGYFTRNWDDFKVGFGNVSGNYWLGNDQIHELTKDGGYKLRVDLQAEEQSSGQLESFWAEYDTFIVGSEATNYQALIEGYSGDAGDPMGPMNGTQFTSTDADNDYYDAGNCADWCYGGFWHGAQCNVHRCFLTGGSGYFYCNALPPSHTQLKTSQMWLLCK